MEWILWLILAVGVALGVLVGWLLFVLHKLDEEFKEDEDY